MKVLQSRRRAGETLSEIEIPPPLSGEDMHRIPVHSRKNPGAFNPLCRSSRQHEDERRVYPMVDKSAEFGLFGCTTSKFLNWNGFVWSLRINNDSVRSQRKFFWTKWNPLPISIPFLYQFYHLGRLSHHQLSDSAGVTVWKGCGCLFSHVFTRATNVGGGGRRWRWRFKWRPKGWSIALPRPPLYPGD